MQKVSIYDIARAIGAEFDGTDAFVTDIVTDSRQVVNGCLFVALEGERVDGHAYAQQALENGASFVVAHKPVQADKQKVLYVSDTFPVMMQIAKMYRSRFSPITVGVTGSVGKTTTKEFIAAVLSAQYKTLKNEGNQNNELGLPRTIFKLDDSYEAAVLEMGMDSLGDIEKLSGIVRPDVGVITNIGVSHLELLGSRENILKAKMEIITSMKEGAPLILNGDDSYLRSADVLKMQPLYYGIDHPANDIKAINISENKNNTTFKIAHAENQYNAAIPTIGIHNVYNALAAFAVGISLHMQPQIILDALLKYEPAGMRQRMVDYGGVTIVEDCYNASPDSMRAALATLEKYPTTGRKICVFADMLELGEIAQSAHFQIGKLCGEKQIDALFAFGNLALHYVEGAQQANLSAAYHFENKAEMARAVKVYMQPGDMLWVKGSRGMALEEALRIIYEEC